MHIPVLTEEVLKALSPREGGHYLDGTLGMGGHAKAILKAAPRSKICGLDRDSAALEVARERLSEFGDRVKLFNMDYSQFEVALQDIGWLQIDGALLDLGVSSYQLDTPERGFGFRNDGPLDMRMDPLNQHKSAWHFVNRSTFDELKNCIATLGEEPMASRIAREIINARQKNPIDTTTQLADLITHAYPAAWRRKARKHPATRTFQAIRMVVNDELHELEKFLGKIIAWLKPGGRLAIISFHSLEDRMVKHAMRQWAQLCICPPHAHKCTCNHKPEARIIFKKPLQASEQELMHNSRASCAKLRAVEKLGSCL